MKTIELPVYGIVVSVKTSGGTVQSSELQDGGARPEFEAAIDGLLGLVLAHACAGMDVEAPDYLEGIEVAVEAIANGYGD